MQSQSGTVGNPDGAPSSPGQANACTLPEDCLGCLIKHLDLKALVSAEQLHSIFLKMDLNVSVAEDNSTVQNLFKRLSQALVETLSKSWAKAVAEEDAWRHVSTQQPPPYNTRARPPPIIQSHPSFPPP